MNTIQFSDGTYVPVLGQGTWKFGEGEQSEAEEVAALRVRRGAGDDADRHSRDVWRWRCNGRGHTGLHLASLGHEVTCADLAESMLERVREAAAERGLAVTTRQHAAEELPYADASFDLVSSRIAPHHFSSPPDFVRETTRVLRPGGWFLLIDASVPDDAPEAEAWLHEVEKLRDPSHHRLLTPRSWREHCTAHGLQVQSAELQAMKQPDLEWYFDAAATPPANRERVRDLVAQAPDAARAAFRLGEEEGRTVWWWPRLTLIARRK